MRHIVIATTNAGKLAEFRAILDESLFTIQSAVDPNVEENGLTYEENALLKATAACRLSNILTLADDSGLEIDALNKKPGILSARFFGADTPSSVKCQRILALMQDVPEEKRSARFVCVVAAAFPNGRTLTVRAEVEGIIAHAPSGSGGFGYDPIFYLPSLNTTMAQIAPSQKNQISHRAKALLAMQEMLRTEKRTV
jgi:XTP/dITP diphosphohydrolase